MNNLHFNTRQLFAYSLLAVVHGGGYLFNLVALSPGTRSLPDWLLDLYSMGWLVAGTWGMLCATVFRLHPHRRTARPLIALAFAVWSSIFIVAFFALDNHSSWFAASLYLLIAWSVADPPSPWGMRKGVYRWRQGK